MILGRTREKGSILLASVIIAGIAAFGVASLAAFVMDVHRQNERLIAYEKASACAEAGIYSALHLFGNKEELSQMPEDLSKLAEQMTAATLPGEGLIFVDEKRNPNWIEFGNTRVVSLVAVPARKGAHPDADYTLVSTAVAKIASGGEVRRTVLADVQDRMGSAALSVPAGLVAGGDGKVSGQFSLRWGDAWSMGNIRLRASYQAEKKPPWYRLALDSSQSGRQYSEKGGALDSWARYRSAQGYITDSRGTPLLNNSSLYDVGRFNTSDPTKYNDTLYQLDDFDPTHIKLGDDPLSQQINAAIDQFAELDNPESGYEYWKNLAISQGSYFRATGKAVLNNLGEPVLNADGREIATAGEALDYYRSLDNAFIAFFDTIDGLPPAPDHSNYANVSETGKIEAGSKGLIYVAGNLTMNGEGMPPLVHVFQPDEIGWNEDDTPKNDVALDSSLTSLNVWHDGVIFAWGNVSRKGNGVVYGAIVTKGSYTGRGDPDIWYNAKLKHGDPQPISSSEVKLLQVLFK